MTDTSRGLPERPMSPHLQVWRWHITMACSILHRGCVIGLYVGSVLLAGWALALALGPDAYACYTGLLGSLLGKLVLLGLTFALFFFVSLSLAKRHSEIVAAQEAGHKTLPGRGYLVDEPR